MIRFRALTAGILVTGLLAGSTSFAQGPGFGGPGGRRGGPGGPDGPGGFAGLPVRELNLTDAQRQQIRQIGERYRASTQIGERLRAATTAHRKAVETLPVNEGLIRSTSQELAQVQADAAVEQARHRAEVWSILTSAQQGQVQKFQADREAQMEKRRAEAEQRRNQRRQQ